MLGTIVTALLAASPAASSWSYTLDTSARPTVSVSNINGKIRIVPADTNRVIVDAKAKSQTGRDAWQVEARKDGDEVRIRVCCGPCDEHGWNRDCDDVGVDVALQVPEKSSLDISSVNAEVQIERISGPQQISTVSGKVESMESGGRLKISAVSAQVLLRPKVLRETNVSSVSGPVKLHLPHGAGAEVSFSSIGGRFNGEGAGLGSITRTFGNGDVRVSVSTVGGELTVDG